MTVIQDRYILNVTLYSGKNVLVNEPPSYTQKIEFYQLIRSKILDRVNHVFTDNYYTRIYLAREYSRNTYFNRYNIKEL